MNMQTIQNTNDLVQLYQPLSLYLKPISNLTITINLPSNVSSANKAVSNFDVMDKLREMIAPETFCLLKVAKSSVEFLKFDAELDDRNKLKNIIAKLDSRKVKITGFSEYASVRAAEAKCDFPARHDWDSFFRDAKNMDEMKAGERPDTMFLSGLPIKWFCARHHENDENVKPSEVLFKRIFEKFGTVRHVDVPVCDGYRDKMKSSLSGLQHFSYDNDTYFEGYVQFSEYSGFVRAMDEFRAMKIVRKDADKCVAVSIRCTFDTTKHLSDNSIKRRKIIRDRLIEKDREKAEEEEKKLAAEREVREKEKQKEEEAKKNQLEQQRKREERRKQKYIQKITQDESSELTKKIRREQKKLLKAQRKVESIRLLESLIQRIASKYSIDDTAGPSKGFQAFDLRSKLKQKSSTTTGEKPRDRSLSISSVSSDDSSVLNEKKKKKKRRNSSSSSSSSESEDEKRKKPSTSNNNSNGGSAYPGWCQHPETGEWLPAPSSYMYPGPFYPAVRPYFNPHYGGPRGGGGGGYPSRGRGGGGYRGRFRRRYDDDHYEHDDRDRRRGFRRSRSRSRSYNRSRSRSRSHYRRRRSYSRSKSRSRSSSRRPRKSRSRTRSKSPLPYRKSSRSRSPKKLVTTLRDGNTKKTPPTTRRNRSKSGSPAANSNGWSSGEEKSRRRRSWSREKRSPNRYKGAITPEKLLKSAREIQIHVQQKLKEQEEAKERRMKELNGELEDDEARTPPQEQQQETTRSDIRSASVDSSKFQSPKRAAKSQTPDLVEAIAAQ